MLVPLLLLVLTLPSIDCFSNTGGGGPPKPALFSLSDRFKATCPAEITSISNFDPSLDVNDEGIWVAVFRSSNNLPSVLIKDDFMNAMRIATTVQTNGNISQSTQVDDGSLTGKIENSIETIADSSSKGLGCSGVKALTPVAVAKLVPSSDFDGNWILESMRCNLKKEDTDDLCDGQSEHAEAISICIDELLLNHLRSGNTFDGTIRTKATLVSGKLLETRGFQEVTELCRDMATHISSLEESLSQYAIRSVKTVSSSPGARDRALQILSFLGKEEIVEETKKDDNDNVQEYDPWANIGGL